MILWPLYNLDVHVHVRSKVKESVRQDPNPVSLPQATASTPHSSSMCSKQDKLFSSQIVACFSKFLQLPAKARLVSSNQKVLFKWLPTFGCKSIDHVIQSDSEENKTLNTKH